MNIIIMEELDELCWSANLSLAALREKISDLSTGDVTQETYNKYPFLFTICMNENVTLEMVKLILASFTGIATWQTDRFDAVGGTTTAYALHCACYNEHCPGSIIKLLYNEFAEATKRLVIVGEGVHDSEIKGLPLHYYLARMSNIDMEIVELLVEAHPQSLMTADEEYACYPIHAAVHHPNPNVLHKIIEYLLELEPTSLHVLDGNGNTPLHLACEGQSERSNLDVFKLLFNTWPEALRMSSETNGDFPIHELCCNQMLEDTTATSVLRFMLSIDSTLARERDRHGQLPIHLAVRRNTIEFCKVLIDAYPESVKVRARANRYETLPIHEASVLETFQYLIELYPESINARDRRGRLPFHYAAQYGRTDIIEFMLKHDPDAASKKTTNEDHQQLPLHLACYSGYLEATKLLYDAFPEAISVRGNLLDQIRERSRQYSQWLPIVKFLKAQLAYARTAKHTTFTITPDKNGWLPLHHALKNKAPLGSIKLLLKGGPITARAVDDHFAFPLHIACEFSSVKVVKYLVELDVNGRILEHSDTNKDSILHYACRGSNFEVIKYLLDKHASLVASAEVNEKGELPIHLLCEAGKEVGSDDSTKYIETIWLMLLANPEVITS